MFLFLPIVKDLQVFTPRCVGPRCRFPRLEVRDEVYFTASSGLSPASASVSSLVSPCILRNAFRVIRFGPHLTENSESFDPESASSNACFVYAQPADSDLGFSASMLQSPFTLRYAPAKAALATFCDEPMFGSRAVIFVCTMYILLRCAVISRKNRKKLSGVYTRL